MKVSSISNLNFAKAPSKIKIKKQKVRILNPEPQAEPDKILVIMGKNPALFCSGGFELRNITLNPERGFVQTSCATEDCCEEGCKD